MTAAHWIQKLDLIPHPEGGYFRETVRLKHKVPEAGLPAGYTGTRSLGTSIYFLLEGAQFSRLHRLKADEIWYFQDGWDLEISIIFPNGDLEVIRIGKQTGILQCMVPANTIFGARLVDPASGNFALVGCMAAPGFEFEDFEMFDPGFLLDQYPQHKAVIDLLSPIE